MTNKRRRIAVVAAALSLLAATAGIAAAETASVTITGGSLSVSAANVTLGGVTLDGTDQTSTSASGSNNWSAVDATGTGVGWNLTIDSTDFTDGGSNTIDVSAADSKFRIQLLDTNVGVTAGNTQPTSSATSLTDIPEAGGSALKFASAAVGDGMGTYTINPNFDFAVPAETYAASYTATITVSSVSAP